MQLHLTRTLIAAAGVSAVFAVHLAWAGDMYSVTVIPEPGTTSPFAIGTVSKGVFTARSNGSKVVIKPSTKDSDGGLTIQLTLKNIDCSSYRGVDDPTGNNKGSPAKCGVVGSKSVPAMPVRDHVMSMSVNYIGIDMPDVAGILIQIQNGVATFKANGKNKIGGAALFGSLVAAVFNNPLGFGVIRFRDAHRVCTSRVGCIDAAPCGSSEACVGGACVPLTDSCTTSNDCLTGACFNEHCVTGVLCNSDDECTAPETCVNNFCSGQTAVGSEVRCNLNSDCAASTPTCANPAQVIACSAAMLNTDSPCFDGTVYAKTGITVGCDKTLVPCP